MRAVFVAVALEQLDAPHGLFAGYSVQVLNPSHTPVVPQVVGSCLRHSGWP